MMGKRLHLWRLNNFNIERLPRSKMSTCSMLSPTTTRRMSGCSPCAEVRDLTPVRDEAGRIVQLPHLERMLAEALAGIRLFQSRRPANERLYWNRISFMCGLRSISSGRSCGIS